MCLRSECQKTKVRVVIKSDFLINLICSCKKHSNGSQLKLVFLSCRSRTFFYRFAYFKLNSGESIPNRNSKFLQLVKNNSDLSEHLNTRTLTFKLYTQNLPNYLTFSSTIIKQAVNISVTA